MSTRRRPRPPAPRAKVQLGSARVNASDLAGLRRAWRARELVLCLGAGVSMPYGLPSWNNLLLELLFEQAQGARRLKPLLPHYRRAVAAWMTDYFDYDPLVLARMVERDLGKKERARGRITPGSSERTFLERLRTHLYANYRPRRGPTTLKAVADLIAKGTKTRGVAAVLSFNFDDLLERELSRRKVRCEPVADPTRRRGPGLRIFHAHGYVPSRGPLARENVVFTEDDYHRLTETVFHWSLSEVVERLRKSTVLFVGLSMSDPNLRRLLDASKNSDIPAHWQIQKRHEIRDHELAEVKRNVEHRARHYADLLGDPAPQEKTPAALESAVLAALRQADTYDREVFESMGVKTIWVNQFEEIPQVLGAIAGSGPSGASSSRRRP